MNLDDMFVFTLAPVDLNKEKVVSALCKVVVMITNGDYLRRLLHLVCGVFL